MLSKVSELPEDMPTSLQSSPSITASLEINEQDYGLYTYFVPCFRFRQKDDIFLPMQRRCLPMLMMRWLSMADVMLR